MELDISKIIIPVFITVITGLLFKPSFFTFFTSSKSERLLLNKELRQLYSTIIILFLFVLMPIMFSKDLIENSHPFVRFLENNLNVVYSIIVIGFLLSIYYYFRFTQSEKNMNQKIEFIILYSIMNIIYLPTLAILYGCTVVSSFSSINAEFFEILVSGTFVYLFLLLFYLLTLRKILHEEIKVELLLSNGDLIKNAYLLHPTYGKRILLGNHPDQNYCKETIVIPLNKIEYVRFFINNEKKNKNNSYKGIEITPGTRNISLINEQKKGLVIYR
jgi:hypothetical protein